MKLKLDLDELADGFFRDSRLIGIVAPVKDYQICWQFNQLMGFDFRNNSEIEIQLNKKNRTYYFSVFEYREPNSSLVHYLYNNEFDGEYLLPEFRHLDFLWLMKGDEMKEEVFSSIMATIREINGVQLVSELSYGQIRNKGHLIF